MVNKSLTRCSLPSLRCVVCLWVCGGRHGSRLQNDRWPNLLTPCGQRPHQVGSVMSKNCIEWNRRNLFVMTANGLTVCHYCRGQTESASFVIHLSRLINSKPLSSRWLNSHSLQTAISKYEGGDNSYTPRSQLVTYFFLPFAASNFRRTWLEGFWLLRGIGHSASRISIKNVQ